jgi:hypothetical protein
VAEEVQYLIIIHTETVEMVLVAMAELEKAIIQVLVQAVAVDI